MKKINAKTKKKTALLLALSLGFALFLAGCGSGDVVLKYSPGSLDEILEAKPELISQAPADERYYQLTVDGETALLVSRDYSGTGETDLAIATPLAPFVAAGLDPAALGEGYLVQGETLLATGSYGEGEGPGETLTDALFESVRADRENLTYHEELDHFGIKLLQGKFEYAKDYLDNDKDIVFILAAAPLEALGVDVRNIEGWIFMTMEEPDGSSVDVLLKPYDL